MIFSKQKNRDAWVAALRSGDYTQDKETGLLESPNGFCCLGVGCEVLEKLYNLGVNREDTGHLSGGSLALHEGEHPQVAEALGVSAAEEAALVFLNDETALDFLAIAKAIENNTAAEEVLQQEQIRRKLQGYGE